MNTSKSLDSLKDILRAVRQYYEFTGVAHFPEKPSLSVEQAQVKGGKSDMSTNNDTELPQASPGATIEDKLNELIDKHCKEIKENGIVVGNIITHGFIYELLDFITTETTKAVKSGFYAGQAMARVELEDCHANWKKWND